MHFYCKLSNQNIYHKKQVHVYTFKHLSMPMHIEVHIRSIYQIKSLSFLKGLKP